MRTPPSRTWTYFFACLSCLDVWLDEEEADCRELMLFTTFVDWVLGKVETPGAAAFPSVTDLAQLVARASDPDLCQASAICKKLNTKSNGRIFQVFVAAMARPCDQS